jgi:hypothetical protein
METSGLLDDSLHATVWIPANRPAALFAFGTGLACWGIGAFMAWLLIFNSASIGWDFGAFIVFAMVVVVPFGDVFAAIGRLEGRAYSVQVTPSGLRGEILPSSLTSVRAGIATFRTPLFRWPSARYPVEGIPWSDLMVTGSLVIGSELVKLNFHNPEHRTGGGTLLFRRPVSVRVPIVWFPMFAERMLQGGADLLMRVPIEFRETPERIRPFGKPIYRGGWLRVSPTLRESDVLPMLSRLSPH